MTRQQLIAFLLFSVVAAGTPGPSNALLTATGARVGLVRGLPALFGVAAGMGAMMLAVAGGLGGIALADPRVATVARWVGAAFLLWMAWKIATAGPLDEAQDGRPLGFVGAAAFQWVNPKSWLVCASAAATFLEDGTGGAFGRSLVLVGVFMAAALPSCLPWLAFGGVLRRALRTERAARVFNAAMALLLVASVVALVR